MSTGSLVGGVVTAGSTCCGGRTSVHPGRGTGRRGAEQPGESPGTVPCAGWGGETTSVDTPYSVRRR